MCRSTNMHRAVRAGLLVALVLAGLAGCKLLKRNKALGQDCMTDFECSSSICSTAGNVCSLACTYDKECGADLVCRRKDDDSGGWCSKGIGSPPNGQCMHAADCQNSICLKYVGKEDQMGLCSRYCQASDDCPAGMKICTNISDTGMLKVCIPGDPTAPAGSGSSASAQFAPAPQAKASASPGSAPKPASAPVKPHTPTPPPQAAPPPPAKAPPAPAAPPKSKKH